MRTALFWGIIHQVVVKFLSDVSGQPIGPIFRGQESKEGKMKSAGLNETCSSAGYLFLKHVHFVVMLFVSECHFFRDLRPHPPDRHEPLVGRLSPFN